jgi:hypothetical protein
MLKEWGDSREMLLDASTWRCIDNCHKEHTWTPCIHWLSKKYY